MIWPDQHGPYKGGRYATVSIPFDLEIGWTYPIEDFTSNGRAVGGNGRCFFPVGETDIVCVGMITGAEEWRLSGLLSDNSIGVDENFGFASLNDVDRPETVIFTLDGNLRGKVPENVLAANVLEGNLYSTRKIVDLESCSVDKSLNGYNILFISQSGCLMSKVNRKTFTSEKSYWDFDRNYCKWSAELEEYSLTYVCNNYLIFDYKNELICISSDSGSELWRVPFSDLSRKYVLSDGKNLFVFLENSEPPLFNISIEDGSVIYELMPGHSSPFCACLTDDAIWLPIEKDGTWFLNALSKEDGTVLYENETPFGEEPMYGAIIDNSIMIKAEEKLFCFQPKIKRGQED